MVPEEWAVDPEPMLVLGVEEGAAALELTQVSDALLLPGGGLLIANSGTSELRRFAENGDFVRAFGRGGQGPGEFSGQPLYLQLESPDSLVVFDAGNRRLTSLDSAGNRFASTDAGSADLSRFRWYSRVYPSVYLVRNETPSVRGCLESSLNQVIADHPSWPAALVRVDQLGYVWATALPLEPGVPRRWSIYRPSGVLVATSTLPGGLEPFTIAGADIVGRLDDSTGVERVARFALHRGAVTRQACGAQLDVVAEPDSSVTATLHEALSSVLIAQEGYYAGHGTYASRAADLRLPGMPDARLVIVSATKRYWVGLMIDNESGATCGLGVGSGIPGWSDAVPHCR